MTLLQLRRKGRHLFLDCSCIQHFYFFNCCGFIPMKFSGKRNKAADLFRLLLCKVHGCITSHAIAKNMCLRNGICLHIFCNLAAEERNREWISSKGASTMT